MTHQSTQSHILSPNHSNQTKQIHLLYSEKQCPIQLSTLSRFSMLNYLLRIPSHEIESPWDFLCLDTHCKNQNECYLSPQSLPYSNRSIKPKELTSFLIIISYILNNNLFIIFYIIPHHLIVQSLIPRHHYANQILF